MMGNPVTMRASFHRVLFAGSLFAVAFSTGTGCNRNAERDEPARCPVVPLSLVMEAPGKQPVEILAVDGRGILRGGHTGAKRKLARLSTPLRPCLPSDRVQFGWSMSRTQRRGPQVHAAEPSSDC